MDSIIKIENIKLWYDKDKPTEVYALKDISLSITKGDYVSFFGPSGCGKTTMLYALSGIDHYQEGKVTINNLDITGLSNQDLAIFRQKGIGIIFQQFNLLPSLTVLQNVILPMLFVGGTTSESKERAEMLLKRLNLEDFANRYPFELSGGQQQRVGIARAIANDPPIIVADEPLGNLDSVNAKNVLAFLKELNEKDGRTIIMVTHEAWSLQDVKTVFYMKDGMLVKHESKTEKPIAESVAEYLYGELGQKHKDEPPTELVSAQVISNFLMRGFSQEEIKRFEDFLHQRLINTISAVDFHRALRRSYDKGGIGIWKIKADRLFDSVETIIKEKKDLKEILIHLEKNPETPIMDEVFDIRNWILLTLDTFKFSFERIDALDQVIADRLRGYITREQILPILTRSLEQSGVGLSLHVGMQIVEKLEAFFDGTAVIHTT